MGTSPNPPNGDPSSFANFGFSTGGQIPLQDPLTFIISIDPGCEFGPCAMGFNGAAQAARIRQWWNQLLNYILNHPWMISWGLPAVPAPGLFGVGPAGSVVYDPKTHLLCASGGLGVSAGDSISAGPITGQITQSGSTVDDVFKGPSIGFSATLGLGVRGAINNAGAVEGPAVGSPGVTLSSTGAVCRTIP